LSEEEKNTPFDSIPGIKVINSQPKEEQLFIQKADTCAIKPVSPEDLARFLSLLRETGMHSQ